MIKSTIVFIVFIVMFGCHKPIHQTSSVYVKTLNDNEYLLKNEKGNDILKYEAEDNLYHIGHHWYIHRKDQLFQIDSFKRKRLFQKNVRWVLQDVNQTTTVIISHPNTPNSKNALETSVYNQLGQLVYKVEQPRLLVPLGEGVMAYYDIVKPIKGSVLLSGKKWGLMTIDNKIITPCLFQTVRSFSGHIAVMQVEGKWGYVNRKGDIVIEPIYEFALPWGDKTGIVKQKGKYGVINTQNKFVVPPIYGMITRGHKNHVLVAENGTTYPGDMMLKDAYRGYGFELLNVKNSKVVTTRRYYWMKYLNYNRYEVCPTDSVQERQLMNEKLEVLDSLKPYGFSVLPDENHLSTRKKNQRYGVRRSIDASWLVPPVCDSIFEIIVCPPN